jgi:N utilization substance protein A
MAELTFNEETLGYVRLFQDVTRTTAIDCMDTPDRLIFVVGQGHMGRAIGKKGEHVATLKRLVRRDVLIVEYSETPEEFVRNVFRAYDVKKVVLEQRGEILHATVTVEATKKGRAIGRDGKNLRVARALIARHHPIQSVSVA